MADILRTGHQVRPTACAAARSVSTLARSGHARAARRHRLHRSARRAHRRRAASSACGSRARSCCARSTRRSPTLAGRAVRGRPAPGQADRDRARRRALPRHPPDDRGAAALEGRGREAARARSGSRRFDFSTGTLILTEAGTKRRASLHLVRGAAALAAHDPGGLEVLDADLAAFRARAHAREPHAQARAHRPAHPERHRQRLLRRDPAPRAAVAGAHDAPARRRGDRAALRGDAAPRSPMDRAAARARRASGFPEKVTAFRPEMAVHGRYGQPCPVCGAPVQRIVHAENETNYCARCQTGGRLLADRALSRLLQAGLAAHARGDGGAAAGRRGRGHGPGGRSTASPPPALTGASPLSAEPAPARRPGCRRDRCPGA